MNDRPSQNVESQGVPGSDTAGVPAKSAWQEPKLQFVEPKLIAHGEVKEVTGGFFGSFVP